MKVLVTLLALGACILTVSSANIPSGPVLPVAQEKELIPDSSVARQGGGWGQQSVAGSEFFSAPTAIFFAPVIAIALIAALWVAAYNTLRSGPPKIGFGAGAQGSPTAGWGAQNVGWSVPAANGGWAAAGSAQYPEYEIAPTPGNPQEGAVAQAVQETVAASGSRSLNDLTQRVLTSIDRHEQS